MVGTLRQSWDRSQETTFGCERDLPQIVRILPLSLRKRECDALIFENAIAFRDPMQAFPDSMSDTA